MRARTLAALLLALACAGPAALGAEGQQALTAKLRMMVSQPRSGGPVPVEVELESGVQGVLQGCLGVVCREDGVAICRYESDLLAVRPGKQAFRLLLPAVEVQSEQSEVRADLSFATEHGTFPLGSHPFLLASYDRRSLVVAACVPPERRGGRCLDVARSLLLGRFDPATDPPAVRSYVCFPAQVPPDAMPAYPLGYCCYDVVVTGLDGLRRLSTRQAEALEQWVAGGGSLCVLLDGPVPGAVAGLLAELTADGGAASGQARRQEAVRLCRHGVGRAVIAEDAEAGRLDLESEAWRDAVAFLWRIRAGQLASVVRNGRWRTDLESDAGQVDYYRPMGGFLSFARSPLGTESEVAGCLLPETIRLVPLGLLALVLGAFVLTIGPLDYWLLGLLKRRRLTWVTFPLASLACAGAVVALSVHYMGSAAHRSALCIVDVGQGGRVLRWSRYEALFLPSEVTAETHVRNALSVPFSTVDWRYFDEPRRRWGSDLPLYSGRFPTDFSYECLVRKWEPAYRRDLSFGPLADAVRLNWDAVERPDLASGQGRERFVTALLGSSEFDGLVAVADGWSVTRLSPAGPTAGPWPDADREDRVLRLVDSVSRLPRVGLFSVVSQLSPNGAPDFEDLGVLDAGVADQWLALVLCKVGSDYYVYRRLYVGGS